jgi:glycosyltransferase involved in cell wall biosynthesis
MLAVCPETNRPTVVLVIARNEGDRIADAVRAAHDAFGAARVIVADGGSTDDTAAAAAGAGAELVRAGTHAGKGGSATLVARRMLAEPGSDRWMFVLCDGDLGGSAAHLGPLAGAVRDGRCDLAVAAFATKRGGGFGIAVGFARRAIRSLTGLELRAPISGQRAMYGSTLERLLPFASGFGMETAMTIDAARAGLIVAEVELDLEHRATGRDLAGFLHRARQLASFMRVYLSRRIRINRLTSRR